VLELKQLETADKSRPVMRSNSTSYLRLTPLTVGRNSALQLLGTVHLAADSTLAAADNTSSLIAETVKVHAQQSTSRTASPALTLRGGLQVQSGHFTSTDASPATIQLDGCSVWGGVRFTAPVLGPSATRTSSLLLNGATLSFDSLRLLSGANLVVVGSNSASDLLALNTIDCEATPTITLANGAQVQVTAGQIGGSWTAPPPASGLSLTSKLTLVSVVIEHDCDLSGPMLRIAPGQINVNATRTLTVHGGAKLSANVTGMGSLLLAECTIEASAQLTAATVSGPAPGTRLILEPMSSVPVVLPSLVGWAGTVQVRGDAGNVQFVFAQTAGKLARLESKGGSGSGGGGVDVSGAISGSLSSMDVLIQSQLTLRASVDSSKSRISLGSVWLAASATLTVTAGVVLDGVRFHQSAADSVVALLSGATLLSGVQLNEFDGSLGTLFPFFASTCSENNLELFVDTLFHFDSD
jgi:hypothetical protein